jgi:hypothetical protein
MREIVAAEDDLSGDGSKLTDARAECREDDGGGDASGFGEVVGAGAEDLVDQPVSARQTEFATGPG